MEFKIDIEDLQKAINTVKDTMGNADKGSSGIRMYASKKNAYVKFTTFDGHHFTESKVSCNIIQAGKAVVAGDRFVKYVAKAEAKTVTIKLDATSLKMKVSRGQQSFPILDVDQFTDVPKLNYHSTFSLPGKLYRDLIKGVAFATATSAGGKPYLEGINIAIGPKLIHLTATDGMTVAYFKKKIEADPMNVVLSKKSLLNSVKNVGDDEKVSIQASDSFFQIKIGENAYYVPQLAGTYPDLKKIIPKDEFDAEFTAERSEFLRLLERSSIILESKGIVKGTLQYEKGVVTVKGQSEEGQFNEKIDTSIKGKFDSITVDIKKLIDIVKHIDSDVIQIGIRGSQPITVRPDGRKDQTCLLAVG